MSGGSVPSLLWKGLASLVLLAFGFASFASGMNRLSAQMPGLARVVPKKLRSDAARSAALLALLENDLPAASRHAAQAVRHDPVDPHSAAMLAQVRLARGDEKGAYAAFRTAAEFGWRDQATQVYWYNQALALGDWNVAMDRADAILRTWPGVPEADALLKPFESSPQGRAVLLSHLRNDPSWRPVYLAIDEDTPAQTMSMRVAVLTQPAAREFGLGCERVSTFVNGLLHKNRRADAEAVWNLHCPERGDVGLLADPGFQRLDQTYGAPFGWIVRHYGDASIGRTGGTDGYLEMSSSAPTARMMVWQPLALEPGSYRISADLAEQLGSGRMLYSFACDKSLPLPDVHDGDISSGPRTFSVGKCAKQQLAIWLRPGIGVVKLKSVQLDRIGGDHGSR